METPILYRGIAVPSTRAEEVITTIAAHGIAGTEGTWLFSIPDIMEIRSRLDWLFDKPDLSRDDLFAICPFPGVCACGSESGALHYAMHHNVTAENSFSIVIEFVAPEDEVYVDPRDFLCTAFQLWDRHTAHRREAQARVLAELFGPRIVRYFEAAVQSSDQRYRIGMCNLAAFDPEVLRGHYANSRIIGGRYNTRFTSAFFVKAPVESKRVRRVYPANPDPQTSAGITLEAFLRGEGA